VKLNYLELISITIQCSLIIGSRSGTWTATKKAQLWFFEISKRNQKGISVREKKVADGNVEFHHISPIKSVVELVISLLSSEMGFLETALRLSELLLVRSSSTSCHVTTLIITNQVIRASI